MENEIMKDRGENITVREALTVRISTN